MIDTTTGGEVATLPSRSDRACRRPSETDAAAAALCQNRGVVTQMLGELRGADVRHGARIDPEAGEARWRAGASSRASYSGEMLGGGLTPRFSCERFYYNADQP